MPLRSDSVSFQIGLCRLGLLVLELRRILHEVMQLEVSSPLGVEGTPIATMQSLLGKDDAPFAALRHPAKTALHDMATMSHNH